MYSPITLGESLTKINNGRFILTETRHEADLSLKMHSHEYANLVCILEGDYTENIGRKSFECVSRSLLLKPAGELHLDQYRHGGSHCLVIEILPEMEESFQRLPALLQEVRYIKTAETSNITSRIYDELCIADGISEMAIEALTLELLVHINRQTPRRPKSKTPPWILQARDFIHDNFADPISLSDIATAAEIDSSHLTRVFRRTFHCSIGEYIRKLRLDYAADQLVKSDRTLIEISLSAGFYDQSHLSRSFKTSYGLTPGKYRSSRS